MQRSNDNFQRRYEALFGIEVLCIIIGNLPISYFGMHSPNQNASDVIIIEMNREMQYNIVKIAVIVTRNVPLLTDEQRIIYHDVILEVLAEQGR